MNTMVKLAAASAAFGIIGSLFATNAAACSIPDFRQGNAVASAVALSAASASSLGGIHLAAQASSGNGNSGLQGHGNIAGLWQFTFTAEGNDPGPPDGTPIDAGFQTWHTDGTELTNSGRDPRTGSFCMGVWKQNGDGTVVLNHWALSWDAAGNFIGPTNIREQLVVDATGNNFSGTFSITQYNPDKSMVLGGVAGVAAASRITADQ